MIAREWRTWSVSRRVATLSVLLVVGVAGAITQAVFTETRPTIAGFGLGVALVAVAVMTWLGAEWFWSNPRRE